MEEEQRNKNQGWSVFSEFVPFPPEIGLEEPVSNEDELGDTQ